jgi:hypothetical protein
MKMRFYRAYFWIEVQWLTGYFFQMTDVGELYEKEFSECK